MNTQLQITCNPTDWDASVITVVGVPHEDRMLQPRIITARDLPTDLFAIWQQAVYLFRSLDPEPDGWTATHIIVEKEELAPQQQEEETDAPIQQLRCCINRIWTSDGTTALPITQCPENAEMILFFDILTTPTFWLDGNR